MYTNISFETFVPIYISHQDKNIGGAGDVDITELMMGAHAAYVKYCNAVAGFNKREENKTAEESFNRAYLSIGKRRFA